MRILWISDGTPPKGTEGRSFQTTPSLSALAIQAGECKTFDAVVLDCSSACPYSVPHILSAAALFRVAGVRLCVLGGSTKLKADACLLQCNGSPELTLKELKARATPEESPRRLHKPQAPKKLPALAAVPHRQGALLMLDVLGSQSRIGCTTQCLQLFHYFSAIGFQPAIVTTPEQTSILQRLMGGTQTDDVLLIDGIAFVTSIQSGYNCYIHDAGCINESKAVAAQNADLCVLVAGIKPWELSPTVSALTLLHDVSRLLTVVSYGGSGAEDAIQALLQKARSKSPAIAAPWQPNPFTPTAIGCYEALRPILETMLKEEELCE